MGNCALDGRKNNEKDSGTRPRNMKKMISSRTPLFVPSILERTLTPHLHPPNHVVLSYEEELFLLLMMRHHLGDCCEPRGAHKIGMSSFVRDLFIMIAI